MTLFPPWNDWVRCSALLLGDRKHTAINDYGSGVCSFSYLRNLPVDILKIDGELVRSMTEDDVNAAMLASIVSMAKAMKLLCVAEFIEDETTCQRLREMGVDYGQGYYFAKPKKLGD